VTDAKATTATARKESVVTVDELIRIENLKALGASRKDAIALGLVKQDATPEKPAKGMFEQVAPPATLSVDAILGVGQDLRADLTLNGASYKSLRAGARVGINCELKSIAGAHVVLAAVNAKVRAVDCPSGDWTGMRPLPSLASAPSGPLPLPLPAGALMPASASGAAPAPQVPLSQAVAR
jgi:hypothetical protein